MRFLKCKVLIFLAELIINRKDIGIFLLWALKT